MSKTKGLGELEHLTPGEKLLLQRRRAGQKQHQAAKEYGVAHSLYGQWERDAVGGIPEVIISEVMPHERCLLYRRRAKFTQARVAREMKICRWWLNQMERGEQSCDDLIGYWEC